MTSEPDWFECDFSFYTIALHAIHKLLSNVFQKLENLNIFFLKTQSYQSYYISFSLLSSARYFRGGNQKRR